jgi:hypothetical protein
VQAEVDPGVAARAGVVKDRVPQEGGKERQRVGGYVGEISTEEC